MDTAQEQKAHDSKTKNDGGTSSPPTVITRLFHLAEMIMTFILILILVSAGVATMNELQGRHQLEAKISAKYDELAAAYFLDVSRGLLPSTNQDVRTVCALQKSIDKLITNGAGSNKLTQTTIRKSLYDLDSPTKRAASTNPPPQIREDRDSSEGAILILESVVPSADNLTLLAILIMSSGTLGAMLARLKSSPSSFVRQINLGMATGFICYAGFVGGKSLVPSLLEGAEGGFSPAGYALFAILVGLFSKRTFEFLYNVYNRFLTQMDKQGKQPEDNGSTGTN